MTRGLSGVAVVTGGAQGIGAGIVDRLAKEGLAVVVADRDLEKACSTSERVVDSGGRAVAVHVDIADPDSVAGLGDAAREAFGEPLRYLVANAGVQTFQHALDLSVEEWDLVLRVNARGTMLSLQSAAGWLPDGAAVVAMASIQGRLGAPYYAHYAASKAAVLSLVKSYAMALAPRRIRVNAVAPGITETHLWEVADERLSALTGRDAGAARIERIAQVPLGRPGTVQDVAAAVAFLLSDDASYITGETIHVSGGDVML